MTRQTIGGSEGAAIELSRHLTKAVGAALGLSARLSLGLPLRFHSHLLHLSSSSPGMRSIRL